MHLQHLQINRIQEIFRSHSRKMITFNTKIHIQHLYLIVFNKHLKDEMHFIQQLRSHFIITHALSITLSRHTSKYISLHTQRNGFAYYIHIQLKQMSTNPTMHFQTITENRTRAFKMTDPGSCRRVYSSCQYAL